MASKVGEGLGLKGYAGPIDTDMLKAAEPGIKQGLDIAKSVDVPVSTSLAQDVGALIQNSANPLTEGITSNSTVAQAAANIMKAANAGKNVPGEYVQQLNSELKALMQTQGTSAGEKQIAGQMIGKLQDALTSSMPADQKAAYLTANKQWAGLKAVENMVKTTNDTGVVMPRQILQSIKTSRFKSQFLDGEAPFQDLASQAAELYGPAGGKGLASVLANSIGDSHTMEAAAILHPHVGIPAAIGKYIAKKSLASLASSENPTVVRLLTGAGKPVDPIVQQYISKALSGAGAAGSGAGAPY